MKASAGRNRIETRRSRRAGVRHPGLLLLVLCLLVGRPLPGQTLEGQISGVVFDGEGQPVGGALITLIEEVREVRRTVSTDGRGRFEFLAVAIGDYRITASSAEGAPLGSQQVRIDAGSRLEVELRAGGAAGERAVATEGIPELLRLRRDAIESLPLGVVDQFQQVVPLVPGTSPGRLEDAPEVAPALDLPAPVDGIEPARSQVVVDGVPVNRIWQPYHVSSLPSSDAIEQVVVTKDGSGADLRSTESSVVVVTRRGAAQFHGGARWTHQNGALDARDFFNLVDQDGDGKADEPATIRNVGSVSLGGPLKKDQLFFFAAWEGVYQRLGKTGLATVPTEEMRDGDFSDLGAIIYDPKTGHADGSGKVPFEDNQIPASRMSAQALSAQNLIPLPNLDGLTNNYEASGTEAFDRQSLDLRIDWNEDERRRWWGGLSLMDSSLDRPALLGAAGGGAIGGGAAGHGEATYQRLSGGHTWNVSPSLVVDGTVGVSFLTQNMQPSGLASGTYGSNAFGIPGTDSVDAETGVTVCEVDGVNRCAGLPSFDVAGFTPFGQTDSGNPFFWDEQTVHWTENFLWSRGDHLLQWGYDLARLHLEDWQPDDFGPRGAFAFNREMTGVPGQALTDANAWASFLLGYQSWMAKSVQWEVMTTREWQHSFFLKDRWQLTPRLTLNAGLRWDYYPLLERDDRPMEYLDLNTFQVMLSNTTQVGGLQLAPRVGLAYRWRDGTILRAGYAVYHDPTPLASGLRGAYPLNIAAEYQTSNPYLAFSELREGLPLVQGPDLDGVDSVALPSSVRQRTMPADVIHRVTTQSWNLTVEQALPRGFVLSAAYIGNQTSHQLADQELNWSAPGGGDEGRQLFPASAASILLWDGWLSAQYHALQLGIDRRFASGLFVKGAYTFSRTIDMTDGDASNGLLWNDPQILSRNRAEAGFSRPHILQMAAIYAVPFSLADGGIVDRIFRNWKLSGIFSYNSNVPFTVTTSDDLLNARGNVQTADQLVSTVNRLGGVGIGSPYFDPSAFAAPAGIPGVNCSDLDCYGTSGRNILRGPAWVNLDLALSRDFRLNDRFVLEVRSECLNVTNTAHFSNPDSDVSSASFMSITSTTGNAPQRILRMGIHLNW